MSLWLSDCAWILLVHGQEGARKVRHLPQSSQSTNLNRYRTFTTLHAPKIVYKYSFVSIALVIVWNYRAGGEPAGRVQLLTPIWERSRFQDSCANELSELQQPLNTGSAADAGSTPTTAPAPTSSVREDKSGTGSRQARLGGSWHTGSCAARAGKQDGGQLRPETRTARPSACGVAPAPWRVRLVPIGRCGRFASVSGAAPCPGTGVAASCAPLPQG